MKGEPMAILSKKVLMCDRCGEQLAFDHDGNSKGIYFTPNASRGMPWEGWHEIGGHHLCPACAEAYLERKEQMQRELDELAGFRHVDVRF